MLLSRTKAYFGRISWRFYLPSQSDCPVRLLAFIRFEKREEDVVDTILPWIKKLASTTFEDGVIHEQLLPALLN